MSAQQRIGAAPRVSTRPPRIASEVGDGAAAGRGPWQPWMAAAAILVGAGWGSNQFPPMLLVYRHALGLDAGAAEDLAGRRSHHDAENGEHDHDDFESFHVELSELSSPMALLERLAAAIARHDILRVKGFLAVGGKEMRLVLQGVGSRLQHYYDRPWRPDEARTSRLVVIGLKGLDRAAISIALSGAAR